jgi:hypothetical protein
MDAQIWYATFSTVFGGVSGALSHVGEVSHPSFCLLLFLCGWGPFYGTYARMSTSGWNRKIAYCYKKIFLLVKQIAVGSYLLLLMQIRTLGMLRVRFKSMPDAFRKCHVATHKEVV